MLIRLLEIDSEQELLRHLRAPAKMDAGVLYVTEYKEFAKRLIAEGLPCIFVEKPQGCQEEAGEKIYGADMIICEPQETWQERQTDEGVCKADMSGGKLQETAQENVGNTYDWRQDKVFLETIWRHHYGLPAEIAQTKRLLLRESVMEDFDALYAIYEKERKNPDVKPFSKEAGEEFAFYIKHRYSFYGYGLWSVVEKSSGDVVGRIGFEENEECVPELAYLMRRNCRGKGYAKEAAQAALKYAKKQLGFEKIVLRTSKDNVASQRLALGLGFQKKYSLCGQTASRESECPEAEHIFFEIDLTSIGNECMIFNHTIPTKEVGK